MSRVSTNKVSLAYAIEESLGVLPTTPIWKLVEPNAINTFGSTISTTARSPISKNRQQQKGTTTDLDSAVDYDADTTMEQMLDFMPSFVLAGFAGAESYSAQDTNQVTAATATDFTVTANGDNYVAGQLVYSRGFITDADNGLFEVDTGATGTSIPVVGGLTAEASPPTAARVDGLGYRGALGDIEIDADGNIISTALDFTTLDLTIGQAIWVGGVADVNRFGTTASPSANRGWARIRLIETNKLTIDKTSLPFVTDAGTAKRIDLYYGRFVRNVPVDDADYLEQSIQFEGAYPDLVAVGTPGYEYPIGNYCNEMTINLPLSDKSTASFAFVGTDTIPASATRIASAANAILPFQRTAFNTTADIARLRLNDVDDNGLITCFKNVSLNIGNGVTAEKCLATLGATFMNIGNLDVNLDAQALFTSVEIPAAIRNNDTLTFDFSLRNSDGSMFFDMPSVTIGDGSKEFPVNESVLINTPLQAFEDPYFGTSIGVSFFPWTPAS